ncbi:MAG TPA: hemolysin family protein [Phycisphaerae bacterium]|nr:hemolysin family protein [Phycisphaerae bacterium]
MSWDRFISEHPWQLALQAVLLAFSAFFSGSETALFSLSRSQVHRLRHGGSSGRLAAAMLARPRRLLNTILLGNMLVNTAYASIVVVEVLSMRRSGMAGWAAGLTSLIFLVVLILLGEVAPKVLALATRETFSRIVAAPLSVTGRVLAPPLWLFHNALIAPLTRLLAPRAARGDVSAEELDALLALSAKRGIIERDAHRLLQEILELKGLRVRDVMVPRVDITAFDAAEPRAELLNLFRRTGFRKVPVYENDIDHVLGLVHAKRLILNPDADVRSLVTGVQFVPVQANLERVLVQFRVTRTQTAIVVDEYGGAAGLVTLEDLLEEIVGDIPDPDEAPELGVQRLAEREYLLAADLAIHEWTDVLGIELPSRRISTVGGFVMSLLGHVALVGEQARYRNLRFTVESVRGCRIRTLRVELLEGEP